MALSAAIAATLLSGCLEVGQVIYSKTFTYDLPKIKNGQQKIVRVQCKYGGGRTTNPPFLDLRCYVVLSNGMTDLAHDVRTIADLPVIDDGAVMNIVRQQATSRCRSGAASAGQKIASEIPNSFWRAAIRNYFNNRTVQDGIGARCGTIAVTAWNELNDNTYSTGRKCLAIGGTLHVDSLAHAPHLQSLAVFPIHETSTSTPGCPRERLHSDNWFGTPWWGHE